MKTMDETKSFIYQRILQTKILGNFDHPNRIPNPVHTFHEFERVFVYARMIFITDYDIFSLYTVNSTREASVIIDECVQRCV